VHPVIEDLCRVHSVQALRQDFFRRCQRLLRDDIQPLLDEREKLILENHTLVEANTMLLRQLDEKRGRKKTEAVPA
jgi:hypothetical protein